MCNFFMLGSRVMCSGASGPYKLGAGATTEAYSEGAASSTFLILGRLLIAVLPCTFPRNHRRTRGCIRRKSKRTRRRCVNCRYIIAFFFYLTITPSTGDFDKKTKWFDQYIKLECSGILAQTDKYRYNLPCHSL